MYTIYVLSRVFTIGIPGGLTDGMLLAGVVVSARTADPSSASSRPGLSLFGAGWEGALICSVSFNQRIASASLPDLCDFPGGIRGGRPVQGVFRSFQRVFESFCGACACALRYCVAIPGSA